MSRFIIFLLLGVLTMPAEGKAEATKNSVYDFSVRSIGGNERALSEYRGKVLLIVNTASKCGFTSQYEGLEELYNTYKDKGFVVLGFPSNDFGAQEPGSNSDIAKFCKLNYGVSFPLFQKDSVKGQNKLELYKFLTENQTANLNGEVKWNFEKFLIDKEGKPVARYRSMTKPQSSKITRKIDALLARPNKRSAQAKVSVEDKKARVEYFFNALNADSMHLVKEFYAENAVFSDPLGNLSGASEIENYYRGLYKNVEAISFDFSKMAQEGNTVMAPWIMRLEARGLNSGEPVLVHGVSHITFNESDGLVSYHRDYFDMGEFIYEHIWGLRTIVRKVKNRLKQH